MFCIPGSTTTCVCNNPIRMGVQECLEDGSGLDDCVCAAAGAGGVSGSGGSSGAAGEAGAAGAAWAPCMAPAPYQTMTCYEYSSGTTSCFVDGGECVDCPSGWLDCDMDPTNNCETFDVYDEMTCCEAQTWGHDYAPEVENCL